MTSGMPAVSPFGWYSHLLNTQEPFDAFACGYGCQDDCGVEGRPGGTGGESRGVFHPSSTGLYVP